MNKTKVKDSLGTSSSYITVAIAFDRHTGPLVKLGAGLAKRLGKRLCLVHVVEPWAEMLVSQPFGVPSVLWNVMPAIETSTRDRALKQLADLAQSVPQGVSVHTVVSTGSPVSALASEAFELGTCLLLVGAGYDESRLFPFGISTGLSLLASSPVPVMVVDTARHLPKLEGPQSPGLKILLADDLSDQSESAVAFAAALADGCGKSSIHHVHVNALTKDNLRTALENAAAAAHTTLSQHEANEVYDSLCKEQRQRLEGRFGEFLEYIEAGGGKYTNAVVPGGVKSELDTLVGDFVPDVMIFGRHKALHSKPFAFGRMPFRAMLALRRPVIVVPS